jgi:hypothetical protein
MPLQLANPSFWKSLNQSCHVGSAGLQQQLLHDEQLLQALHDGLLQALHDGLLQALHDGLLQALHDGQLLQALHDGQLLQALHDGLLQALHDGQLLPQLHAAAPTDTVNATTKKTASKTAVAFFILSKIWFFIYYPPIFFYVDTNIFLTLFLPAVIFMEINHFHGALQNYKIIKSSFSNMPIMMS